MNLAKAKEILKPWELHKQLPFIWLTHDEHGNYSGMTIAEAYGFINGVNSKDALRRSEVEKLFQLLIKILEGLDTGISFYESPQKRALISSIINEFKKARDE